MNRLLCLAAVAALSSCGVSVDSAPAATRQQQSRYQIGVPHLLALDYKCSNPVASLRPSGRALNTSTPAANNTVDEIRRRGHLVVGVGDDTYLFGYREPRTGRLTGFDIALARKISKALFGSDNRVRYEVLAPSDRESALVKRKVDIVVDTYTITCQGMAKVDFSAGYYTTGQRLLVGRGKNITGMKDLTNRKVCALAGSKALAMLAVEPTRPIPVSVANLWDCVVLLQQEEVSAIFAEDAILAGAIAQDVTMTFAGPRLTDEAYGVGLRKGDRDMVRFVNTVIELARQDGSWGRDYYDWVGYYTGEPATPPLPVYRD